MIKNLGARKLSVTSSHRRSMLRNMATSLFQHEKVETTLARAKELVSFSEKLITTAKPSDLNAKRAFSRDIKNADVQKKVFDVLVPRYKDRKGGYTRIYRLGSRVGDNAQMALVKLIS
ncbi:MAG: 50S ribosomal protein L17 [Elusimicrobiota bacterium]